MTEFLSRGATSFEDVDVAFAAYEEGGFAAMFMTPYCEHNDRIGQAFAVVGRVSEDDRDFDAGPMWTIRFEDGVEIVALPEEICNAERDNACYSKEAAA